MKKPTKKRSVLKSVTSRRLEETCDVIVMGVDRGMHEDELEVMMESMSMGGEVNEVKMDRSHGVAVVSFKESKSNAVIELWKLYTQAIILFLCIFLFKCFFFAN